MSLLTIAIPTFNRSYSLGLILDSICKQLNSIDPALVDLMVLDNCSPDDTEAVVLDKINNLQNARYVRHATNIGADNNFVAAFSQAQGDYVWILGDDELLFDGAIPLVLALCARENFGAAYLCSVPVTLANIERYVGVAVPGKIECRSYGPWQFAQVVNYQLTFLSGSIVNKKKLVQRDPLISNTIDKFKGSNLVHLSWILTSIISSGQSVFVKTPVFASTVANSGGYNPVSVFLVNLGALFDYFFADIDADAKGFVNYIALIGLFPRFAYDLRFKSKYDKSLRFVPADFPDALKSAFVWKVFALILTAPRAVAFVAMGMVKIWHKIYQMRLNSNKRGACSFFIQSAT